MVRTVIAASEDAIRKLCETLSRTTDGNPITYELIAEAFEDPNFIPPERWN